MLKRSGNVQVNVTADHRVIYGADLASFLQTLSQIIEDPKDLTFQSHILSQMVPLPENKVKDMSFASPPASGRCPQHSSMHHVYQVVNHLQAEVGLITLHYVTEKRSRILNGKIEFQFLKYTSSQNVCFMFPPNPLEILLDVCVNPHIIARTQVVANLFLYQYLFAMNQG